MSNGHNVQGRDVQWIQWTCIMVFSVFNGRNGSIGNNVQWTQCPMDTM